ncbi:hypothetical protein SAMN05661080_03355 [Modestobacter sp. DSM 44400]|uniref:hypothetical protein n=1 Tax=Modestobacter sp. DSM 44400 TaxID=1550230 RepID=UPI0008976997|nr:hypothetical protein [Modestobacter sp. DSM 44400]SDY39805.1 hypothetical protein SAMN05661080_03355 [Modestobacter sp. DSM 44400]
MRARIEAGDRDGAAVAFLTGIGTPDQVVAMMRTGAGWPRMCELAPTLVYDLTLTNGGVVPVERLARIAVPTLVLAGGPAPRGPPGQRRPSPQPSPVPRKFFEAVAGGAGPR